MRGRSRFQRKIGASLALLALWLQLVLSFGHIHPEDFFSPRDPAPVMAQNGAVGTSAPAAPAKPAGPTHDDCAICISLAIVGASAMPAQIALLPPALLAVTIVKLPVSIATNAPAPRPPFQTRAPPLA